MNTSIQCSAILIHYSVVSCESCLAAVSGCVYCLITINQYAQPADVIGWFEVDVGRKGSPSDGEGVAAIIKSNGNEC